MATDLRKTRASRRVRRRKHRRNLILGVAAYLLVLGGLSAGCCWSYFWLLERPALTVSAIEVSGLVRLERAEVLAAAGVGVGAPVVGLDFHRLERRIERLEWVESAQVGLRWPLRLAIDIKEKAPLALIRLDRLYYLDENGRRIKRLSPLEGMDYPVITGVDTSDDNSRKLLCGRVIPLLVRLAQDRGKGGGPAPGLAGGVSEVHVSEGGRLSLYTMEGLLIRLGQRDCEAAIRDAGLVVSDLKRRGLLANVAAVNASCPARVFVTFSRGPEFLAATSKVSGA